MGHTHTARDIGLLALRTAVGGSLAFHGAQKLFGWFGGHGLDATAQGFESMGFTPGKPSAALAGFGELAGAAIVVGAGTPIAASGAVGAMIGAASVHTPNGFSAANNGYEYPAVLGVTAASLALTGPGKYSVDHLLGDRLNRNWQAAAALAAATAAGAFIAVRRNAAINALAAQQSEAIAEEIDSEAQEGDFLLGDYNPETGEHDGKGQVIK